MTGSEHRRRVMVALGAGALVGAGSAVVRPYIRGGVHYETIVSMFLIMPAICLALAGSLRRVAQRWALAWLAMELAVLWIAFSVGWSLVFGRAWEDMLALAAGAWLITTLAGVAGLFLWQSTYQSKPGPYCPACDYCLIGVPIDCCPECGRPFTLDELGITREALTPPAMPSSTDRSRRDC